MTEIHLLVITGAQTVKNQDCHASIPIVQVMIDFYRPNDTVSRPRIFALVSLLGDRQAHFDSKLLKLEQTFFSRVWGVSDRQREEILALPDRPNEVVVLYDPARKSTETRLLKHLHQLDPAESIFHRHYRDSRHALEEVGPCASDLVWRRALKNVEAGLPMGHDDIDEDDPGIPATDRMKAKIYRVVKNWSFTMPNLDPSSRGFNVSHKFLKLMQVLSTFRTHGEGFRGIIFVQRRGIALVLADLIRTLDDQFLRPQAIVGCRKAEDQNQHQEIFYNFASGLCNLLVATKSIEDLDVPKATVVIRYDVFESQISHAYVRSRTRGRESHLIHMVERDNDAHRRILSKITGLDADMLRWTETLCNNPECSIPPESLRETNNPYHSDSDDDEEEETTSQILKDPTTNGRIYQQDATTLVLRYAASLKPKLQALQGVAGIFIFHDTQKELGVPRAYICTLNLPGTPLDNISGEAAPTKAQTRRSACFKACERLYQIGLLDSRFVPMPCSIREQHDYESGNRLEAPGSKATGTREYTRKQPSFWTNAPTTISSTLYPTIISVGGPLESQQYGPLVLLTKIPLPPLPSMKIFSSGVPLPVSFSKALPLQFDDARLKTAHAFTTRVCRAIMNKALVCPLEEVPYLFLPLPVGWKPMGTAPDVPDITDVIPWETVEIAAKHWAVPINFKTAEELERDLHDAVVQDRWIEFTRRFRVTAIRRDLNPLSRPIDSPRETRYKNLFEFCKSKRKGLTTLTDLEQPIVEVTKIDPVMNHLTPSSKPPAAASPKFPVKYFIPEICAKFTVPASTLATSLLMPSVMRRLDDILLVKELDAKFFDHAIREDLLHIAICAPSAGLEYDYERLELLGDAFLKYLSSLYCFVTNPSLSEGALHKVRQKIISNKALFSHATRVGLAPYIQSKTFLYKSWQPPNFYVQQDPEEKAGDADVMEDLQESLQGESYTEPVTELAELPGSPVETHSAGALSDKISATEEKQSNSPSKKKKKKKSDDTVQWLGDKAIADVAEAIIGAAYISGGREVALRTAKAFTLPLSNIERWADFGRKVLTPPPNVIARLPQQSVTAIEEIIGHKFNRPHLLGQAMTHSSIQGFEFTSYERLEFIGDAILDFMVIRYIFDRDQTLSPGGLTMLKGAMVSNSALAAVCAWSGLHEYLLFESTALSANIQDYISQLKERQEKEYASATQQDRPPGQYWLDLEPPKALSDVIESIVGAIYISDGFSPIGAETLFDNVLKPFYDKHITMQTLSHHPTKILFELLQSQGCQQFEIIKDKDDEVISCNVLVHEVVLASAEDTTLTSAARQASLMALDAIEGDPEFMARTCNCKNRSKQKKLRKKSSFEIALERALAEGVDEENEFGDAYKDSSEGDDDMDEQSS
ncbi:ribonuclease III [Agrocybe pediades]|nr:ribonuclease III [Agrocybe pediades]